MSDENDPKLDDLVERWVSREAAVQKVMNDPHNPRKGDRAYAEQAVRTNFWKKHNRNKPAIERFVCFWRGPGEWGFDPRLQVMIDFGEVDGEDRFRECERATKLMNGML